MYENGKVLSRFVCTFLICCSRFLLNEVPECEGLLTRRSREITMHNTGKGYVEIVPSVLPDMNDSSVSTLLPSGKESKQLGDRCSSLFDCSDVNAICSFGVCTCPRGYYEYRASVQGSSTCRAKRKFNETCIKTNDCKSHDTNSLCAFQRCRCVARTRFMKPQNFGGKCYKIGLDNGDACEIDEQCKMSEGYKCKCSYFCFCEVIDAGENSVKIENILIGIFASMGFLIGIQLIILFLRKQFKGPQQQEQTHLNLEEISEPIRAVPSASHEVMSSQITDQTIPRSNRYGTGISETHDSPPSYEDVCKNDKKFLIRSPPTF